MHSRLRIDELRRYANAVCRLAHAPFEEVAHAQIATHLLHIDGAALVDERRIAGDHEELAKVGQCGDDVFDRAVGKVLLLGIATHVLERQDGNRWLVGQGQAGRSSGRRRPLCRSRPSNLNRIDMHRLCDVLEPGLAKIADGKLEPRSHLPVGVLRKTYGSRLGNVLQARRDVDAVTHQVAIAFLDDVAEMNADAKFDAPLRRQTGVALDHQVLNLDAATNSVDDTAKFHEDSITGSLHDASVVDGDCRIDQVASQGTQPCQRPVLVRSGQPAESDDVRREDRSKLSRLSHVRASGLATQYLRTRSTEIHFSSGSQFPNGIVSSVSFVSTTNTARSLAGSVSLALALTLWRSPGSSEKLCPAL